MGYLHTSSQNCDLTTHHCLLPILPCWWQRVNLMKGLALGPLLLPPHCTLQDWDIRIDNKYLSCVASLFNDERGILLFSLYSNCRQLLLFLEWLILLYIKCSVTKHIYSSAFTKYFILEYVDNAHYKMSFVVENIIFCLILTYFILKCKVFLDNN